MLFTKKILCCVVTMSVLASNIAEGVIFDFSNAGPDRKALDFSTLDLNEAHTIQFNTRTTALQLKHVLCRLKPQTDESTVSTQPPLKITVQFGETSAEAIQYSGRMGYAQNLYAVFSLLSTRQPSSINPSQSSNRLGFCSIQKNIATFVPVELSILAPFALGRKDLDKIESLHSWGIRIHFPFFIDNDRSLLETYMHYMIKDLNFIAFQDLQADAFSPSEEEQKAASNQAIEIDSEKLSESNDPGEEIPQNNKTLLSLLLKAPYLQGLFLLPKGKPKYNTDSSSIVSTESSTSTFSKEHTNSSTRTFGISSLTTGHGPSLQKQSHLEHTNAFSSCVHPTSSSVTGTQLKRKLEEPSAIEPSLQKQPRSETKGDPTNLQDTPDFVIKLANPQQPTVRESLIPAGARNALGKKKEGLLLGAYSLINDARQLIDIINALPGNNVQYSIFDAATQAFVLASMPVPTLSYPPTLLKIPHPAMLMNLEIAVKRVQTFLKSANTLITKACNLTGNQQVFVLHAKERQVLNQTTAGGVAQEPIKPISQKAPDPLKIGVDQEEKHVAAPGKQILKVIIPARSNNVPPTKYKAPKKIAEFIDTHPGLPNIPLTQGEKTEEFLYSLNVSFGADPTCYPTRLSISDCPQCAEDKKTIISKINLLKPGIIKEVIASFHAQELLGMISNNIQYAYPKDFGKRFKKMQREIDWYPIALLEIINHYCHKTVFENESRTPKAIEHFQVIQLT